MLRAPLRPFLAVLLGKLQDARQPRRLAECPSARSSCEPSLEAPSSGGSRIWIRHRVVSALAQDEPQSCVLSSWTFRLHLASHNTASPNFFRALVEK